MSSRGRAPPALPGLVGGLAVAAAALLGALLRLADPLSTSVIPAEDPYTHMAFVREHLRTGSLGPLYEGGAVYPPGMHALLAAVWVFSGLELYAIIRFAPVLFGALGVIGMGALVWRQSGPLAGFVAALAYALMPEVIFRTTMMAPTAVDLAILPFFLLVLLEIVRGRLAWIGVALPFTGFLVVMHPWVLWVLALAGGLFVLLALLVPWPRESDPGYAPVGLAAVLTLLTGGAAGAVVMGAGDVVDVPTPLPLALTQLAAIAFLVALTAFGAVLAAARPLRRAASWWRARAAPAWLLAVFALLLAAALVAVTRHATQAGLPRFVDLPAMIGRPILLAAAAGFVLFPFARTPLAHFGAAVAGATYPFVVFDVFSSPFWPHRTVAFLAIGLAILVGVLAAIVARAGRTAALAAMQGFARGAGTARAMPQRAPGRAVHAIGAVVPSLFVLAAFGGGLAGDAPEPYEGWYRLFGECEQAGLVALADAVEPHPDAIVVAGSWQAKLVVAALASNATRIWYSQSFFLQASSREEVMTWLGDADRPLFAVADRHFRASHPEADLGFLAAPPWRLAVPPCLGDDPAEPRLAAYLFTGGPHR